MAHRAPTRMSVDEFFAYPWPDDGLKRELIDGMLVVSGMPVDRHEAMVVELVFLLRGMLHDRRDLALRASNGGVIMGADTVLTPDLFVYQRIPGNPWPDWRDVPVPLLVVEILSPSTARRDRGIKRMRYLEHGVAELWIVDAEQGTVERWWPGREPVVERGGFAFEVGGVAGRIDLPALLRKMRGEG